MLFRSDIIGILLFTYHVWAPAIIVPVVVGAISKEHSPRLTRAVFITILVAVITTFIYRATPFADSFDPAVFGVLVSCVVFIIARKTVSNKPIPISN